MAQVKPKPTGRTTVEREKRQPCNLSLTPTVLRGLREMGKGSASSAIAALYYAEQSRITAARKKSLTDAGL